MALIGENSFGLSSTQKTRGAQNVLGNSGIYEQISDMNEKKNISFVFFLRVWTSNIIRFVAINLRKKSVGSKKFPFDEIYHHSRKCGEIFSLPTPNCTVFRPLKFEQVKQWNPYGYFAAPKYRVVKLNCTTEIEGFYTMLEISFYFQCDLSQTA